MYCAAAAGSKQARTQGGMPQRWLLVAGLSCLRCGYSSSGCRLERKTLRCPVLPAAGQTPNSTATLEHLAESEPDLVILVGDLAYAGKSSWATCK